MRNGCHRELLVNGVSRLLDYQHLKCERRREGVGVRDVHRECAVPSSWPKRPVGSMWDRGREGERQTARGREVIDAVKNVNVLRHVSTDAERTNRANDSGGGGAVWVLEEVVGRRRKCGFQVADKSFEVDPVLIGSELNVKRTELREPNFHRLQTGGRWANDLSNLREKKREEENQQF